MNTNYFNQGIDLIVNNTPLTQGEAGYQLNKQEGNIHAKNYASGKTKCMDTSYYKLASGYVINKYKTNSVNSVK